MGCTWRKFPEFLGHEVNVVRLAGFRLVPRGDSRQEKVSPFLSHSFPSAFTWAIVPPSSPPPAACRGTF